ncbi:MAG TPA: tRNA-dihydrouridine synthase family protein [Desulfosarcina sp.]|nr:tRNA-dihydrouridine synthase family protein [Desulfosarcina sp.]
MKPMIMAPLRGFTDAVFRNAFKRHFYGIDEAVAPFVTSIRGRRIKPSHLQDLAPAANRGLPVVPQILSNSADEFVCLANALGDLGYVEVNWNLGCPYPMVAKKMRGSGLLPHPDRVDRMLDAVLSRLSGRLSIKTRLGRHDAGEMAARLPVFNRYPLARVIVHPRTGVQMYDGSVDLEAFGVCLAGINHPVVYNGDINDVSTLRRLEVRFPEIAGWMLGRGILANPFLPEIACRENPRIGGAKQRFFDFHDHLIDAYSMRFSGPGHVLDRMKGLWRYFRHGFADGRRILKRIRKTDSLRRYREITQALQKEPVRWFAPDTTPDRE